MVHLFLQEVRMFIRTKDIMFVLYYCNCICIFILLLKSMVNIALLGNTEMQKAYQCCALKQHKHWKNDSIHQNIVYGVYLQTSWFDRELYCNLTVVFTLHLLQLSQQRNMINNSLLYWCKVWESYIKKEDFLLCCIIFSCFCIPSFCLSYFLLLSFSPAKSTEKNFY